MVSYFDVATRTWSSESEGASSPISYHDRLSAVHIPLGKNWLLVHSPALGGPAGGFRAADLDDATPNLVTVTVSGGPGDTHVGLTWDSANSRVLACDKSGNLYACTPPSTIGSTWTWTTLSNSGESPDAQTWSGEGVWGRFGYVNDGVIHGVVLCSGPDTRPWFYKL